MKKLLLTTALLIISSTNAQTWQNLGTNGIVSPEPLDIISQLSIAISSNNVPYVCHAETANFSQPSVKRLSGNAWVYNGVAINNNQIGHTTSMALDNQNVPYVAYSDFDSATSTTTSYVKRFDGTGWVLVGNLGFATGTVGDIILRIDNNNVPYVSYNRYGSSENVVVKKFDGTNWNSLGVVTTNSPFYYDFDIDNNNNPVVTYDGVVGMDVYLYAKKFIGTSWTDIGTGALVSSLPASRPSLAFDTANNPTIAYLSGINPDLNVKKFIGTSWTNVGATVASINIEKPRLAIGPNNIPIVAYKDQQNGDIINVKKLNGTTWDLITTPTSFEAIDNGLALTIGSNNIPYITYSTSTSIKAKFYDTNLSTTQNEIFSALIIYPNPTNGFLNIDTKVAITKIRITDLLGKTVLETSDNFSKIDISNLNTAVYLLKIQVDGLEKTYKIFKI
ncbi:T9SS type A sorting domain-containing protein [Flavobacterium sp.]|uniref:T9SS type A sorting domain-containing protein n=1 Tax=Flavobacterium sp. TaxID=239 RepID=UPI0037510318